ncbi:MAG: PKD domain-containing protein, partial [Candidatus Scalindua sp. AMX11]
TGSDDPGTGSIVLYEWDFEGDGTFDFSSADTGDTPFTYSVAGTFTATLRVTDDDGNQVSDSVAVEVVPLWMPTATATADPVTGITPLRVDFTGTGIDPDGTIAKYQWNFGENALDLKGYPTTQLFLGTWDSAGCLDTTTIQPDIENQEPSEGEVFASQTWFSASDSDGNFDWDAIFGDTSTAYAYSHIYLYSDFARIVRVWFGADDSARFWVNGALVHTKRRCEDVRIDKYNFEVNLNEGWNRLLVSVSEGTSGWGLAYRITDTENKPLRLPYSVDKPTGKIPPEFWVSATTGNTNHTYSGPGIYRAILTVTDNDGNRDTDSVEINVFAKPVIKGIETNLTGGQAPLELFFSGEVADLDGTIVKYEWDFDGDGTYDWVSKESANGYHVYGSSGTYDATLRVTDSDGFSATDTVQITVGKSAPAVNAKAAPVKGNAPLIVNFFDSSSDPDGTITRYEWDFDGDGIYDYDSLDSGSTTHTYTALGTYRATLRVTDDDGLKDTDSVTIEVSADGTPSVFLYATPRGGVNPLSVHFYGHGTDPDGTLTLYEWDFDGDGTYDRSTPDAPTAFADRVEDGTGYWSVDPPWARTFAEHYSPSYSWTDSPGGDYADNEDVSLTVTTIDLSNTVEPKLIFWHRYDFRAGDFGRVEISGNDGSSWKLLGSFSNGTVNGWKNQEYDLSGYSGNSTVKVRFRVTSNASDTGDGWYIDDVWVGDSVTHTYKMHGNYTPILRVTDNNGSQATASIDLSVLANPNTSYVWVADYLNHQIARLSDDGREHARIGGFSWPRAVDVDTSKGDVWVADTGNDRIVKLVAGIPEGYHTSVSKTTPDSTLNNRGLLFGDTVSSTGNLSGGFTLDGNGDYVLIPSNSILDVQNFTIEAWIRPTSANRAVFMRGNSSGGNELLLWLDTTSTIQAYLDNGSPISFSGATNFTDGSWHHVAMVYDARVGQLSCFVDGAIYGIPASLLVTLDFGRSNALIGADLDSFNRSVGDYFIGQIDEVRLWNVIRSESEIANNKDTELTGSESGLVGYWKLNTISGTPYHQIITGFDDPYDVSADASDGSAWVTDYNNNEVVKIASDGEELSRIGGFRRPRQIDVDVANRSVWIADTDNDRVIGVPTTVPNGFIVPAKKSTPDSTVNEKVGLLFGDAVSGTGQLSGGVSLDGDGDYLLIPSDEALDVQDHTVEAWIRPTSANRAIFMRGNSSGGNELLFWLDTTSTIQAYLDNGPAKRFSGTANFTDGAWHHVAMVYDSSAGQVSCYVDGALYGTPVSLSVTLDFGGSHALIGADFDSFNRNVGDYFSGDIDEVRLWNEARTESEIAGGKDAELTGTERGLVGYWKLNTTTDTHVQEVTGFNDPIGISVDQTDGSVWVADNSNHQVVKIAPDGTELYRRSGYNRPVGVSANQSERTAWVADSANDQVVKLAPRGSEIVRLSGFDNPNDLDVNPVDGSVWIADQSNDQVVKLAPDGRELFRLSGFSDPLSVSVDAAERNLNQPPVVTSSADPAAGERPLEVTFKGSATDNGSIVKYEWDFDGDGLFDYDSPTTGATVYTYRLPGTYNPVLRVTDNEGLLGYDSSQTIYVGPMTVYPGQTTYEGDAPYDVTLGGFVRGTPSDRHIVLYEWDFDGDGLFDWSSPASPKVAHKYDTGGTYTAILRVTDDVGNQTHTSTTVTVNNVPLTATNDSTPTIGVVPLSVNLRGSGRDVDGSVVRFEWDYDGDGVYDWFSDSTGDTDFTYTHVGTYTATLRVTDNDGLTATAAKKITVNERREAPIANASADVTEVTLSLVVNFLGTGSDPDDGTITLYEWDFEGDGTYDFSSPDTGNTSHTYNEPGEYGATLRVTDLDKLTATDVVVIMVKDRGIPTAVATVTPASGPIPLTANFDATGSTDPDGDISLYEWTFGNEVMWAANSGNSTVVKLEGYGEDSSLSGFNNPKRVSVNRKDGTVWVSDQKNDQVVKLRSDGRGELKRISGFNGPEGISVNRSDGTVWVADYLNNQVVKLDQDGGELVRVDGFNRPISVSVNSTDGTAWIADQVQNQMVKVSPDGRELARVNGFNRPHWVSVNSTDGSAWVADRSNNKIVKLSGDVPDRYNVLHTLYVSDSVKKDELGLVFGDTSPVSGKIKGGLSFDLFRDYLEVSDSERLRISNYTVEVWIKPNGIPNEVWKGIVGKPGRNFNIWLNREGYISHKFHNSTSTNSGAPDTPKGSIDWDEWNHIAITNDGTTAKTFINGVERASGPSGGAQIVDNKPLFIGRNLDGAGGGYFHGVIDDVRIWNVVRSEAEIMSNKDSELTGTERGLVGYWKMDTLLDSPFHKSISGFNQPSCVSVNPNDGTAWVCDYGNNEMVKISEDCSREIVRVGGYNLPNEAFVNPEDGTVLVADFLNNRVVKLSEKGEVINRVSGLNRPTSVGAYHDSSNTVSSTLDGSTTHVYNKIGSYRATLKVTDNDGLTDSDPVIIKVGNFPESLPDAHPVVGSAPLKVRFSSNGRSPDTTIEFFHWDFDGNGSVDWTTRISENREHTYRYPGTYTATQKVIDNNGQSDTKPVTITVTVPDEVPLAEALANPVEGNAPLTVDLTGLGKDSDGFITKYEWDFEGDGVFDFASDTTGITTHTFDENGIYNTGLRVTDNDGNKAVDSVRIEVKPPGSPTSTATISTTGSGEGTLHVSFSGGGEDDGKIVLYEWDFDGDGTYDWSSPTTGKTNYNYPKPGKFSATLRVTDDAGLTDTYSVKVDVTLGLSASLSGEIFDPSSGDVIKINSVYTGDVTVTVKIKDKSGEVVRTLVDNVPRTGGYYSDMWDGRDDNGLSVDEGVYFYIIEYTEGVNSHLYDITNDVSPNRITPPVVYPANFNPFSSETNFFRYTLNTKSEVTVYVSPFTSGAGDRVKTLILRVPQRAGRYVMVWDGTDDLGNLVEPKNYVIAVMAWRLPENAIIVETKPIISDLLVTPTHINPDARPYGKENEATFTYTLSKMSNVAATIFNENNFIVKNITVDDAPEGTGHTIVWDGKNDRGKYVKEGIYRLKLVATDKNGRQSREVNGLVVVFY